MPFVSLLLGPRARPPALANNNKRLYKAPYSGAIYMRHNGQNTG